MDAVEVLNTIAQQVAVCEKCPLHFSRKRAVPGEGQANAGIMFIGEGPGFYENEQGRPFVGPSGKFLDELLQSAGLKRSEVFIGNVVKCRPPANRDPEPEELLACRPYLDRQIEAINPKVVVTLGRYSMAYFMPNGKISAIHGRASWVNNRMIVPMYHPAAALHQPALRSAIVADFANLPKLLARTPTGQAAVEKTPPAKPDLPVQPMLEMNQPEKAPEESRSPAAEPADEDQDKPVQLSLF